MNKKSELITLNTIPKDANSIKTYYEVQPVKDYFSDFENVININKTVEDLLQTVDLIALAYQISFNNGLKCAPILAIIKTDYLSLVSKSSVTILDFKSKSQNAIFTLYMTSKIFNMLNELIYKVEPISIGEDFSSDLEFLKSEFDELDDLNSPDAEDILVELNILNKKVGLETVELEKPFSKLRFKKIFNSLETKINKIKDEKQQEYEKENNKKVELFKKAIDNISRCSAYAIDMEKETVVLIDLVTKLKEKADEALKNCVEQDVSEKEKKKELEISMQKAKEKQATLEARQNQLNEDIEEIKELEAKIEKKLEAASTKAFWLSITNAVTSMVSSGLNAYVQTKTLGLSNLNTKIDQSDKEVERLEKSKKEKEEKLEKIKKEKKNLEEEANEIKEQKEKVDKKLKSIIEEEKALLEKQEKLEKEEDKEEELEKLKKELKEIQEKKKDQVEEQEKIDSKLTKKEKEVKESKKELEDSTAELKAVSEAFGSLSQSLQEFKDDTKSELEMLQKKEEQVYNEKKALQKERRDNVGELAGVLEELKNARENKDSLEMLISALKLTSETIQKIIVAFERIKRFWESIRIKCEELAKKSDELKNNVILVEDITTDNFKENYDLLIDEGFFDLVFSWIALEKLNSLTLEQMNSVLSNLEDSFTNPAEVETLYSKIKHALVEEEKRLDYQIITSEKDIEE